MTEITKQVTLGNLISAAVTLGTTIALVAAMWGALNGTIGVLAKGYDDHEARLRMIERETTDRLTRIEAIVGRIDRKVGQ